MTGGRLKRVADYIKNDEAFCFTYGNGDANITKLIAFHKSHGKLATLTITRPSGRCGAIKITDNGTVDYFQEKPNSDGSWINDGFFVPSPEVIQITLESL